jgi:hypothetical protein
MYKNDFLGLEFISGDKWSGPPVEGKVILSSMYEMDVGRSKWWDLLSLVAMVVAYRVIFLVMIKSSRAYRQWRQRAAWHLGVGSPASPTSSFASSFSFSS